MAARLALCTRAGFADTGRFAFGVTIFTLRGTGVFARVDFVTLLLGEGFGFRLFFEEAGVRGRELARLPIN